MTQIVGVTAGSASAPVPEKTKEEQLAELNAEKKAAWENYKNMDFDSMSEEDRVDFARRLYETMATTLAPDMVPVLYDFWKEWNDTDEIKDIRNFMNHVETTLSHIPANPSKDSWLDKQRGIIPNMKREWKEKVAPFTNEYKLREQIKRKAGELFAQAQNQDKEIRVDIGQGVKDALKNIEDTLYKPTREKIEKIEEEVKKRVV